MTKEQILEKFIVLHDSHPNSIIMAKAKCGDAVADHEAENYARDWYNKGEDRIIASEIVIEAARALIHEQEIDYSRVIFYNEETDSIVKFDKDGRSGYWPDGFCESLSHFLRRII